MVETDIDHAGTANKKLLGQLATGENQKERTNAHVRCMDSALTAAADENNTQLSLR